MPASGASEPRLWPATRYELEALAANLRADDVEEMRLAREALTGLTEGWNAADDLRGQWDRLQGAPWAMSDRDGTFLGLCGIEPFRQNPAIGAVWFLGTPEADARPIALTKGAKAFLAALSGEFFAIGNIVPDHYKSRQRWLEHLGFDLDDAKAQPAHKRHVAFWSRPRPGPEDRMAAPREGKPALRRSEEHPTSCSI